MDIPLSISFGERMDVKIQVMSGMICIIKIGTLK
jgi:hypothetical protein